MTRELQILRVKNIEKNLLKMSSLVEKQIYESMLCLKYYDLDKAEEVIKKDDVVDEMHRNIEEECVKFIATEQPVATDLRRVFAASKIVTDLERMADHAVDVCKLAKKMGRNISIFNGIGAKLLDMDRTIRAMINAAIDSYIKNDTEIAYSICKEDDKIDEMYIVLFEEILAMIKEKDNLVKEGAQLLFIIKYLERIADHVTNICEWTIFSKDGIYVDLNE